MYRNYCMRAAVVMVTFNERRKWDWAKQAVTSFRKHLSDVTLVVVDHNHISDEQDFLESNGAIVLQGSGSQYHGDGLDLAADWCRANLYHIMVHIEPDCIITGNQWLYDLVNPIENGYWMAGAFQLPWGTIHICMTSWLIQKIPGSFSYSPIIMDREFRRLVNADFLNELNSLDCNQQERWMMWDKNVWDTGLKNWFDCACYNKSKLVNVNDINHLWNSRYDTPTSRLSRFIL